MATKKEKFDKSKKFRKGTMTKKDTKKVSDKRDEYYDSSNDPAWYIKNEQLLRDAASIPFSNLQGVDTTMYGSLTSTTTTSTGVIKIGTIATHYLLPAFGGPEHWSDPMNVASTNLYSFVRHANSGSKVYDKSNLMIYTVAMGSLYSFIEWCKRLYGMVGLASVYNRSIPAGLIRSNGVSFSDLSSNISQFRTWLNRFILRCSIFGVPAKLPFFDRQQFIYRNIYSDATNVRAQIQMYAPLGFHIYQEPGVSQGTVGTLKFTGIHPVWNGISETLPAAGTESTSLSFTGTTMQNMLNAVDDSTKLTVAQIIAFGEAMLAPLASSEDFGIISGDILKAFGPEGMKQLTVIPEDYVVLPDYKPEVLHQMHNIHHMFPRKDLNNFYKISNTFCDIAEDLTVGSADLGALTMDVLMYRTKTPLTWRNNQSILLDFDKDSVTPADIVVATRLCATGRVGSATSNVYPVRLDVCGTEVCAFTVYQHGDGSTAAVSDNVYTDTTRTRCIRQHFKLAPICYDWNSQTGTLNDFGVDGEVQNYTAVTAEVISNITAVANLGLYDVPTIGGWNVKG